MPATIRSTPGQDRPTMTDDAQHPADPSPTGNDIAEISQRIMVDIESASSRDLSDARYARKILQLSDLNQTKSLFHEIESAPPGPECVIEKRAVIKALLLSTWLQRLYFSYQVRSPVDAGDGRYLLLRVVLWRD